MKSVGQYLPKLKKIFFYLNIYYIFFYKCHQNTDVNTLCCEKNMSLNC